MHQFTINHWFPLLLSLTTLSHAKIGVLDWENSGCNPEHLYDGLRFTNARQTICTRDGGLNSVSNGTTFSNDVVGMVAKHMAGIPFTPISIDLGEYSLSFLSSIPLVFTGHREGAEPVSVTFTIDGLADSLDGIDDFQTFLFPASFANITELHGPTASYSCDNFLFETVVPPPFPNEFTIKPKGFSSFEIIHSRHDQDNDTVVGSDFFYHTGFRTGDSLHVLGNSPSEITDVGGVFVDPTDNAIFYSSRNYLYRKDQTGTEELVSIQEVNDSGIPASNIGKPMPFGDDLLFLATHYQGMDSYRLLKKSASTIDVIVDPETSLPLPGGSSGFPHYSPDFLAASGNSFAFDTSVSGSPQTERVYAVFSRTEPIQLILSEGDMIDTGSSSASVNEFLGLRFSTNGKLEITANTSLGEFIFTYESAGTPPTSIKQISGILIAPEGNGELVSGKIKPGLVGGNILDATNFSSAIFREHGGRWYRIIGEGDFLGTEKIKYLSYLATPSNAPDRLIVDVRFENDSSRSHNILLNLSEPTDITPRIGQPVLESGHMFIPIDRLTYGKRYFLSTSSDLDTWTNDGPDLKIEPQQHRIIYPENLGSHLFFRIQEKISD